MAAVCAAAASTAALSSCGSTDPAVSSDASERGLVQYGFWMDSRVCAGCASCVEACREANGTPDGCEARRKVVLYDFDQGESRYVSVSCMHCAQPACVAVCPAGAISKRADGIVAVDQSRCIGCKYCQAACPFGAPHYTPLGMDKCDCCLGAGVKPGKDPHCVQACPARALRYGEIEDLYRQAKEAAGRVRLLESATEPSFCLT